ncbi:KICSTOR complex protein C12orf66 homolog isoform X2 [Limulus polyphemus]|nr:KICSTOR complex protein C12orf66 homolog isoform X2 [Limulus polyphemus]XP_022247427.1 KICSTOR complex protein C12orf66 homolog isoform X2 [Limulus polyphemus]
MEDVLMKEQAVLESYFHSLACFAYDKAKETVERERDVAHKAHQTTWILNSMLTALSQFAAIEKNYTSLLFLVPKGFLRKDSSLKTIYETLRGEFRRLEERSTGGLTPSSSPSVTPTPSFYSPSPPTPVASPSSTAGSLVGTPVSSSTGSIHSNYLPGIVGHSAVGNSPQSGMDVLEKFVGHLCGQLFHFICARLSIMHFYEKMYTMSSNRFMKYKELIPGITEIVNRSQRLFHHPLLSPLKSAFGFECRSLLKLLEAQVQIQQLQFLPALLSLYDAHSHLGSWASTMIPKAESRRLSCVVISRPVSMPALYRWLFHLKSTLVAKFTLYFHDILSKQTTPLEMKNICFKTSTDLYQKLLSYHRRSDALFVALVFDTHGLENYKGPGYHHPNKLVEPPKGLDSYPTIVCYPAVI